MIHSAQLEKSRTRLCLNLQAKGTQPKSSSAVSIPGTHRPDSPTGSQPPRTSVSQSTSAVTQPRSPSISQPVRVTSAGHVHQLLLNLSPEVLPLLSLKSEALHLLPNLKSAEQPTTCQATLIQLNNESLPITHQLWEKYGAPITSHLLQK